VVHYLQNDFALCTIDHETMPIYFSASHVVALNPFCDNVKNMMRYDRFLSVYIHRPESDKWVIIMLLLRQSVAFGSCALVKTDFVSIIKGPLIHNLASMCYFPTPDVY
jgi:hypothetical protein